MENQREIPAAPHWQSLLDAIHNDEDRAHFVSMILYRMDRSDGTLHPNYISNIFHAEFSEHNGDDRLTNDARRVVFHYNTQGTHDETVSMVRATDRALAHYRNL